MELEQLIDRLRNPDPCMRVETLRILAMVEETRALDAIRWVYLHDPEIGVREVAGWAGKLIWKAHKRGHSTEQAVHHLFDPMISRQSREEFVASQAQSDLTSLKHRDVKRFAAEQRFRRKLDEILRSETSGDGLQEHGAHSPDHAITIPALLATDRSKTKSLHDEEPLLDLLDAGLSDEFWQIS